MSTLFMVRHGQASFGAADYDQLSELGIKQSIRLGQFLAAQHQELGKDTSTPIFDAVYVGPCKRHQQTYDGMREGAGPGLLPAHTMAAFDEYPAFELLKHWTPKLKEMAPEFQALFQPGNAKKQYKAVFDYIVHAWARGELSADAIESFDDFHNRVESGLQQIMQKEGRGKRILLISSGGPVSLSMRIALGLPPIPTLELGWVIANSSLTEYRYQKDTLSLVSFNAIPHLRSSEMITYR